MLEIFVPRKKHSDDKKKLRKKNLWMYYEVTLPTKVFCKMLLYIVYLLIYIYIWLDVFNDSGVKESGIRITAWGCLWPSG